MAETITLELLTGESMTIFGLKVTFKGGATMNYASRPPAGAILLELAFEDQVEEATCMERNWGEPESLWGFTYTILNGPELSPKKVRLLIQNRS